MPRWLRNTIELVGHAFFLLPLCLIMIVTGIPFAASSAPSFSAFLHVLAQFPAIFYDTPLHWVSNFADWFGNLLGLGFSWAANRYHFIPLPPDIYFIAYLPFKVEMSDVLAVNAMAILLSIVATWYPARTASRLDPIVAIREEA